MLSSECFRVNAHIVCDKSLLDKKTATITMQNFEDRNKLLIRLFRQTLLIYFPNDQFQGLSHHRLLVHP